jgi:hypothetical protein
MKSREIKHHALSRLAWALAPLLLILSLLCPRAACAAEASASSQPVTTIGQVQGISEPDRKLTIDGTVYDLAPDLVVKNAIGNLIGDYQLHYFTWAHTVEFTRMKNVIKVIRIIEHTS